MDERPRKIVVGVEDGGMEVLFENIEVEADGLEGGPAPEAWRKAIG